jgi:hypothetical protein
VYAWSKIPGTTAGKKYKTINTAGLHTMSKKQNLKAVGDFCVLLWELW